MKSCDKNKKLLLDLLAFIAFDMLDEKYNNNKLIITNRAKKYLDNNYTGRFDYIMNLKPEVIASTFMKEGRRPYLRLQ
jgi:transcriptional antiterminator